MCVCVGCTICCGGVGGAVEVWNAAVEVWRLLCKFVGFHGGVGVPWMCKVREVKEKILRQGKVCHCPHPFKECLDFCEWMRG